MLCDLDGDGLKDLVLMDDLDLSIFYQDRGNGFTAAQKQTCHLEHRPCVVWPAKLGKGPECLLVMTGDGVDELDFTNRTGPPVRRQIIRQATLIPPAADGVSAQHLTLSARTGDDWPLILVPVIGGLQVWQHGQDWRQAQFIANAVDSQILPSIRNPGFHQAFNLNLCLSDVEKDGRDELMICHGLPSNVRSYAFYPRRADGLFATEPAMTYTNKSDWRTVLDWVDINRDGKVDLVKGTFLNEPSFLPWVPSAKTLVGVYLADQQGRIPTEPQQVFRKHDWSSSFPVVDVDGDGFADMILGYVPFDTREQMRKLVTTKKLGFTLKVHFFRPGAGYSPDPDCQREIFVHVDKEFFAPISYYEECINLEGDFNGDGEKDLLVRDRAEEISVYFFISREKGFNMEPDLQFHCPEPISWTQAMDLNGDGMSDLIVKLRNTDRYRIYLSQSQ